MTTRLDRDRAVVRQKMPPDTVEKVIDGVHVWYYWIKNELGESYYLATHFDGSYYHTTLIEPAGLETDIVKKYGAHMPHAFSDGYLCLSKIPGGGVDNLQDCWARTALWAYHMTAFRRTGKWLFLNE